MKVRVIQCQVAAVPIQLQDSHKMARRKLRLRGWRLKILRIMNCQVLAIQSLDLKRKVLVLLSEKMPLKRKERNHLVEIIWDHLGVVRSKKMPLSQRHQQQRQTENHQLRKVLNLVEETCLISALVFEPKVPLEIIMHAV